MYFVENIPFFAMKKINLLFFFVVSLSDFDIKLILASWKSLVVFFPLYIVWTRLRNIGVALP